MNKKITKIISAVLTVALLLSCFTVFSFADTSAESGSTQAQALDDVTVLVNRTFSEGWDYSNGFIDKMGNHKVGVEYEETDKYEYNYYTRIEGVDATAGYVELNYGSNSATYGKSFFEVDIKTDDFANLGVIGYAYRKESTAIQYTYPLISITNNTLNLVGAGSITYDTEAKKFPDPSYTVGSSDDEWIRVVFELTVNQRVCNTCGTVHTLTDDMLSTDIICCKDEEGNGEPISKMAKAMSMKVYFGYADTFNASAAIKANNLANKEKDLNNTYYYTVNMDSVSNIDYFRIGLPASGTGNFGSGFLFDNVKLYNGADEVTDISSLGYGLQVDSSAAKTIEILGGEGGKNTTSYINEGLAMKVGVEYCLDKNARRAIIESDDGKAYGAPVKIDGKVYVPLQAVLDWVGYPMYQHEDGKSFDISTASGSTFITIGRGYATANGELVQLSAAPGLATDDETGLQYIVVALSDIETLFDGYFVTYDDMGLIIISGAKDILNRESDLSYMLDIMKRFIYPDIEAEDIYDIIKDNTGDFQHPYIIADQSQFDYLYVSYSAAVGSADYDANFSKYLNTLVKKAEEIYLVNAVADPTSAGKYLAAEIVNPHTLVDEALLNNGYEFCAGRLNESAEYNENILSLAIAYHITHNEKYAGLAYEMAVSMGKWSHWGPAYFVSLANATTPYALAYDWLYNVWSDMGYDLAPVEQAIYEKCISQGYYASNGIECEYLSNQGDFSAYTNSTTSWNAISTSGMVIGSLALMGAGYNADADGRVNDNYSENYEIYSAWLIDNNLETLIANGLDMYAPDGSYIESPEYWSYSTNALALMSWALKTAMGDDLGIMNTWGMDKTFYYAYQTEYTVSSVVDPTGYHYWAYHNAYANYQSTDLSFYVSSILDDATIAALRVKQLARKDATIWDVVAYTSRYSNIDVDSINVALDYVLESCEGIVSRSSWADGALFVGIMGNENNAVGGQMDSGNFVYVNKGFEWVTDLGAEDYTVYGYSSADHKYGYYRESGEGANVVVITSNASAMPDGQILEAGGTLTRYGFNDYGMYAIIDNSSVYGSTVNYATRGMLLTNNRSTVIVQDSMAFTTVSSCAWVCQTPAETVTISSDGRTAFMRQKLGDLYYYVRASIVSEATSLRFQTSNCYQFLLSGTHAKNYATVNDCNPELDRSGYKRLYIESKDVMSFECAVVFEVVVGDSSSEAVQYEYKAFDRWDESLLVETFTATVVDENTRGNSALTDVATYTNLAEKILNNGYAFSTNIKGFYRNMVYVAAAVKVFEPTGHIEDIREQYEAYLAYQGYLELYKSFRSELNYYTRYNGAISDKICGYVAPVES